MRPLLILLSVALATSLATASAVLAAEPPAATTGAAKDVGETQATLTATVDPKGSATSVHFELGTSTSYGLQSAAKDIGNGTTPVTVEIPVQSLSPSTTYHFRVVATSLAGTFQGADATLKTATPPVAPTRPAASTGGVRDVTPSSATLTASVNPHGAATSTRFEYGTTTAYGATTAATDVGAGTRTVAASATTGALQAGKRYHYRVVAVNGAGTSRGGDRTFTAATTPTAATLSADKDPVTYGGSVVLSGKLDGSRRSGVRVRLQTTVFPFDSPFADKGAAVKSSSTGTYTFTLPVTATMRALVVADGAPSILSRLVVIRSAARAGITSVTRSADGRTVTVSGRVIPATAQGIAALQREGSGGRWVPLRRVHVGSDGRYTVPLRARRQAMTVRAVGLTHDGGAHVRGVSRTVRIGALR
ncbi:MAG: hypothetical protein QOF26_2863 [Baekduia sp.]|nr:hypothetical protein [Baekduia sp.]